MAEEHFVYQTTDMKPKVAVQSLTFGIREKPGSNLDPESGQPT